MKKQCIAEYGDIKQVQLCFEVVNYPYKVDKNSVGNLLKEKCFALGM